MAENSECKSGLGQIQIADEVIAVIASTASMEIEGVHSASLATSNSFVDFFGKRNQSKGVKVSVEDGDACIDIDIAIDFGIKIQDSALEVQKRVKNAIETMTGLNVSEVNVNITGIVVAKAKEKENLENI